MKRKAGTMSDVGALKIEDTLMVKAKYHFSAPEFWMWKMYQFGFAKGKQVERARRAKSR